MLCKARQLTWSLQDLLWVQVLRNRVMALLTMEASSRIHLEISELKLYLKIYVSIIISPILPSAHMEYYSFVWQL